MRFGILVLLLCTVEDIRPGADGELNKKLLTQFVLQTRNCPFFPATPISPLLRRNKSGQEICFHLTPIFLESLMNSIKQIIVIIVGQILIKDDQARIIPIELFFLPDQADH